MARMGTSVYELSFGQLGRPGAVFFHGLSSPFWTNRDFVSQNRAAPTDPAGPKPTKKNKVLSNPN
jgi:hypothetical protein